MTRKVVHLTAFAATEESFETVYALCNDGSVWWFDFHDDKWHRMKDIPQGDDPEE